MVHNFILIFFKKLCLKTDFFNFKGGSTFCSIASLYLMNRLNMLSSSQIERLKLWCLNRQTTGFNGRVNKPWDTCYSFWIGSTLKVIFLFNFVTTVKLRVLIKQNLI